MAEVQTNISGDSPFYRGRIPTIIVRAHGVTRRIVAVRPAEEEKEESRSPNPGAAPQQGPAEVAAPSKIGRRAYNREYMRQWRKRNQERYREYNREYQRKRHMERKIDRILNAPADDRKLCGYGCGRPAVETIERIDPRTWKSVQVPYCGHC